MTSGTNYFEAAAGQRKFHAERRGLERIKGRAMDDSGSMFVVFCE
jgi:hypothetical protein